MQIHTHAKDSIALAVMVVFQTAQSFAQPSEIGEIDSVMRWSNNIGIYNGNVLVSKNDKIIYEGSFGYADAAKKNKLNANYRFNIGSITKEFSAASLMKLKEQGKLKLDDPVSRFVPGLPGWANGITIKDLLQYTSGLPDINWDKVNNDKDIFEDLKQLDSLAFKPGTSYYYNNNNIALRQFVVEHITKMNFNRFAEKFIFAPCNMQTAIMNPSRVNKNIAKSFNNDLVEDPTELPMSGAAYVTTHDLLKWAKCLHAGKVINKQSIFELGQHYNSPGAQAALGNVTFDNQNIKEHQHDGQSRNFEALMFYNAGEDLYIILLGNNVNEKVFEISFAIRSILKGEKYTLPKKSFFYQFRMQLDSLSIDDFISFYQSIKASQSYIYDVDNEGLLNRIGYYLMNSKRLDDCIKIFDLNIREFPSSSNVYDSMGEAFYNKGDFNLALLNYKKSLELDPKNDNAKQMIEKIEQARR